MYKKFSSAVIILVSFSLLTSGCRAPTAIASQETTISREQLVQYTLELINEDRATAGAAPLTLGDNPAAQNHAEDMLANYYLSHWDTDGMKPYMRYTTVGGVNYEEENSAYHGWFDKSQDPALYAVIDLKQTVKDLEYNMMFDDADSGWGHRDAIINKLHKKVNIGIAYDNKRLALVEQFEGDYVSFIVKPNLFGKILSLSGSVSMGKVYSLHVFYDPMPETLSQEQLLDMRKSYDQGEEMGYILPPKHHMDGVDYVAASKWDVGPAGSFNIQADVTPLLKRGSGVYTFRLISEYEGNLVGLSNYSITRY